MKKPISIQVTKNDKSPQAKRYKQFNALVDHINALKEQLETLQGQMNSGSVFYHAEIKPLHKKQQKLIAEEIRALHQAYPNVIFGRKDREKIAQLIVSRCRYLFHMEAHDFEALIEIFNHYADRTWEELESEKRQLKAERTEELLRSFGLDIELDEEDDFEQILEKAQAAAQHKEQENAEQESTNAHQSKTEKQKLKDARERQKEKDVQKVSKNIYNELVKLLHPDLESDEEKKVTKTEIIQRVNEAYARNDFFALLNLQAEYLNRQSGDLALMPDKEFKYYLQVLKTQEEALLAQLDSMGMDGGFETYIRQHLCHPNPITMKMFRQKAVREEKEALKAYQHNLALSKNAKSLKEALQFFA